MRRDLHLALRILETVERHASMREPLNIPIGDHEPEEVHYHIRMLAQAGYIEAEDESVGSRLFLRPRFLTWTGHDFLAELRAQLDVAAEPTPAR